ncbi:MAG TPA: hypothetical protein VI524_08565 [Anaerolineales bacterium]|nr:hypothetical protein [Anaerolineales bacterium]
MENLPTKLEFSQNLQTTFHLDHGGREAIPLKLIELQERSADPGYEQFSLLFHGPNGLVLPQQTYQMKHEQIGEFDLFLVPLANDRNGFYYEAVFNQVMQLEGTG